MTLISATKGVETETLARMSEVTFEEAVTADREVRFAVLSGPNFAVELAAGAPTSGVVASNDNELATTLRHALSTPTFRLYSTTDVVGVELGAASKNVIAIAAGIVAGLELGHNALAALMTRGLHEITRLGLAYGGQPRTLSGLAGMGDLVLTWHRAFVAKPQFGSPARVRQDARGNLSRYADGGRRRPQLPGHCPTGEASGSRDADHRADGQILYHGKPPKNAVRDLMARELRAEAEL